MKILFVIDSLGSAGKERQLIEHLKTLKMRNDFELQLVVLSDYIDYKYLKYLDIKTYFIKRKINKDLFVFIKLYKICKEFKPNIIYSWERMCTVYTLPIAKALGLKFINGVIRNAPLNQKSFRKGRIMDKLCFSLSDVVLANSYAGLKSFKVPIDKGYCIHNGFNFSRIQNLENSESIKKKFAINTANVVGMVGHFANRKDFTTFLLSAVKILHKRNDVTFLAVGDGSNARGDESKSTLDKCKEMVNQDCKDKIKFLGKQDNVESIVNIFDVGVLLTNQEVHGEGISNSIMEYMSLAKPVIATDGGGTREIVIDKKTGFLVESHNVDAVAEKIEYLLNNKEVAIVMGNAGKERLLKEFDIKKMTDRYIEIYQKCVGPVFSSLARNIH